MLHTDRILQDDLGLDPHQARMVFEDMRSNKEIGVAPDKVWVAMIREELSEAVEQKHMICSISFDQKCLSISANGPIAIS